MKTALSSENDPHVDLHDRWLSVLPPRSVEWKREQKRPRAVRLKDIEDPVVADKVSTHELTRLAQAVEREQSVGRRLTQQSSAFLARRRSDRRELLKSADVAASWEAKAHSRRSGWYALVSGDVRIHTAQVRYRTAVTTRDGAQS